MDVTVVEDMNAAEKQQKEEEKQKSPTPVRTKNQRRIKVILYQKETEIQECW